MKQTTIINLWGGPGSGKSTTAAEMFAAMKRANMSCELITEYVKAWAWRGEKIGSWDDIYITAKQLRRESAVYGKVDFVVTDSPLGLGGIFEQVYNPVSTLMRELCLSIRERQISAGLQIFDCFVQRLKPYHQAGRYEDETAARRVDEISQAWLREHSSRWSTIATAQEALSFVGVCP